MSEQSIPKDKMHYHGQGAYENLSANEKEIIRKSILTALEKEESELDNDYKYLNLAKLIIKWKKYKEVSL